MIRLEQFKELGIKVSDELTANSALEYINNKTTLTVDLEDVKTVEALPFSAKLFVQKYGEVASASSTVASENIEGLSLTFKQGNKADMIKDLANTYLSDWLVSEITFIPATRRWN